RLLASTLMRSSMCRGKRNEIDCVEGLRLANTVRLAFDQSTYSVESCVSQKLRSSSSEANFGMGLSFLLIDRPLLFVHVTRGDHADSGIFKAQGKSNMQEAPSISFTKGMPARLILTVFDVCQDH